MNMSKSQDAIKAYDLVKTLQKRFVDKLDDLSSKFGENKKLSQIAKESVIKQEKDLNEALLLSEEIKSGEI